MSRKCPSAAVAELANITASAQFEADLIFLSYLAERTENVRSKRAAARAVKEFAVQFRATAAAIRASENGTQNQQGKRKQTAAAAGGRLREKERARKSHPSNGGG